MKIGVVNKSNKPILEMFKVQELRTKTTLLFIVYSGSKIDESANNLELSK